MRVNVARNRNLQQWSIRERGKVRGYRDSMCLKDVEFHVNVEGSRRIREGRRRYVVAWAKGTECDEPGLSSRDDWVEVTFSPYVFDSFYETTSGQLVAGAEVVIMLSNGRLLAGGVQHVQGDDE